MLTAMLAQAASVPHTMLAHAKAAVGGKAWDQVTTLEREYTDTGNNGQAHGTELLDLRTGHYTSALEAIPGFPFVSGWDGRQYWESQFGISAVKPGMSGLSAAFRKCLGQWYARCGRATFQSGGERLHAGQRFDVVRVTPHGSAPFESWINRRSGRIERVRFGSTLESLVEYADFRRVGRLWIAFEERYTLAPGAPEIVTRLHRVRVNPTLPAHAFALPVDAAIEGLQDMPEGVSVDFENCENHLCVKLDLNGQGPFRFILDTGSANVLSPAAAARLDLVPRSQVLAQGLGDGRANGGVVKVARVEMGPLTQQQQTFFVVELGYPGIDGLLGYGWLRQCVTRIDWAKQRLTFTPPSRFHYQGTAGSTMLDFTGNTPRVEARIDGQAGWFYLDTGDWSGVTLNANFARKSGLAGKYAGGEEIRYGSIGGEVRAQRSRADMLELGGMRLAHPSLMLSQQSTDLLSAPGLAGNLGHGVLHRMNIVLDYPGHRAFFEPNEFTEEAEE
ncbi:MAG: aspartyl protease family protein [Massilia sp.]